MAAALGYWLKCSGSHNKLAYGVSRSSSARLARRCLYTHLVVLSEPLSRGIYYTESYTARWIVVSDRVHAHGVGIAPSIEIAPARPRASCALLDHSPTMHSSQRFHSRKCNLALILSNVPLPSRVLLPPSRDSSLPSCPYPGPVRAPRRHLLPLPVTVCLRGSPQFPCDCLLEKA